MNYMKNQLVKTNKEYYFFEAVDGNCDLEKYNFSVVQEWHDPYTFKAITKGEIGCALSHYIIWKRMIEQDIDNLIILEDDVTIDDNFDELLDKYIEQIIKINKDYDILYLGRNAINDQMEVQLTDNIVEPKYTYWTCGYILNKSGAKKLVESNFINAIIPVDEFISLMFDKTCDVYEKYNKYYKSCDLIALSVNPYLIFPKSDAFFSSDTYNSFPLQTKPYTFNDNKLIVLTVGTNETDGLIRFKNYCSIYGFYLKVLGMGEKWLGGNMMDGQGGGQKINLLKEELDKYSKQELKKTLILFSDSYDVIICGSPECVINKFKKFKLPIIFSAEKYCWPDKSLKLCYDTKNNVISEYKYLNSGGFIGWAKDIYKLLIKVENDFDDQLFYTYKYLEKNNILLDNCCQIFQTLNGVGQDLEINYKTSKIKNKVFNTEPIFIHGNGPIATKLYLNTLENYTGLGWNNYYNSYLDRNKYNNNKTIFVACFQNSKINFNEIEYPKHLLTIKTYNNLDYKKSILDFQESKCDYYFHVLDGYIFKNKYTLADCLAQDKNVVCPLFRICGKAWSNFWGALDDNGYYKRSFDYFDILGRKKIGCWNVPYITGVFLIKKQIIIDIPHLFESNEDADMGFCENLRYNGVFMYLINYEEYGQIQVNGQVRDKPINLYSFNENEWENKFLHPEFLKHKNNLNKLEIKEICSDAYNFPLFSQEFCEQLVTLCEQLGEWSPGKNNHYDPRLGNNAYENVPTQDIHLKQLNFDKIWEQIIFKYIAPIAELLYNDYQTKGTNINFVVKYSLEGQKELKPHHDGSTYTINIALNNDFEGGGCRFIRQKVDHVNKEIGTATIHPGKLTHYHKGLPITSGKRYILVSFVN